VWPRTSSCVPGVVDTGSWRLLKVPTDPIIAILPHIPRDRPLRGVIIMLEPFYAVESMLYDEILTDTAFPIAIADASEIERVTAMLADEADGGRRLIAAISFAYGGPPLLRHAVDDLTDRINPIVNDGWERWIPDGSYPADDLP
jgi:hypothetical protein